MLDVLVVGSGYAGASLAAAVAGAGRVCIVERGSRWLPGSFPETLFGLSRTYASTRNPKGLWAMRLGRGTGLAFANAVGGSSVVNYGITVRPDDHVFDGWPISRVALDVAFERALAVLRPCANPRAEDLGDKAFLDRVAPGTREDILNTIDWSTCTDCGRCVPGCNVGAKRSLDQTYLPLALARGAELRVETEVTHFAARPGGGYRVFLRRSGTEGPVEEVETRHLVLAAGTLGTLDLLHRVRAAFPLGPRFGSQMSLNGDGMAFLYDVADLSSHSGAPISTAARLRFVDEEGRPRTLYAMSGRVPKAIMPFAARTMALGVEGLAWLTREGGVEERARQPGSAVEALGSLRRRVRDLLRADASGAFSRTFMYKLDGEDSASGMARFGEGGAVVDWPCDYLDEPVNRFADATLQRWAAMAGGRVVGNVARLPGMRSFSVHPLGGCAMGRDVSEGVVDEVGRVLRPEGGLYPDLRVADGSIMRGALGVPPSLTIAALADHIGRDLARALEAGYAAPVR